MRIECPESWRNSELKGIPPDSVVVSDGNELNKLRILQFPNYESKMLFVSEIIETFEDFLEKRGIDIPNNEKDEDPDASLIYGTDYGELQTDIETIINYWHAPEEVLESDV